MPDRSLTGAWAQHDEGFLNADCALTGCGEDGSVSLRVEIHPAPDGAPIVAWAHRACFERARDASVAHDDPRELGRIPCDARCAFCGRLLPIVGKHPFAFDVGRHSPPRRYWSHGECLTGRLVPSLMAELRESARDP